MCSKRISKEEVLLFLEMYGFNSKIEYSLIKEGIENKNYLILTEKKTYVLRIYSKKKFKEVNREIELLEYLSKNKIPLPKIFLNRLNQKITVVSGSCGVLFSFMEGEHPPWKPIKPSLARNIGIQLAKMHDALIHFDENSFSRKKIRNAKTLRKMIIHGDITRENILVKNNQLQAFLDFDDFHKDYLVRDVAIALTQLFVTKSFGIDWHGMCAFIGGYSSIFSLRKIEKKRLIPFMKSRNIEIARIVDKKLRSSNKQVRKLNSIKKSVMDKLKTIGENESKMEKFFLSKF